MAKELGDGTLSRTLNQLALGYPELLDTAVSLIVHFSSDENYTPTGSEARDSEARKRGEFKESYRVPSELAVDAALNDMNADRELTYAA